MNRAALGDPPPVRSLTLYPFLGLHKREILLEELPLSCGVNG